MIYGDYLFLLLVFHLMLKLYVFDVMHFHCCVHFVFVRLSILRLSHE